LTLVVATQFLTHIFDNFSEKSKIAKKKQRKTQKMYFWYICLFLAFSTSSQKNLNFQRYLERVQLLTRKFYDHWFSLLSWRWYCSFSKIQKKIRKIKIYKKKEKKRKGKVEGLVWKPSKTFPINTKLQWT
jgi:hypothetical protein